MFETPAAALLTTLDPLDYPTRMRRLAEETRRLAAAADGNLDAVLDALSASDVVFERQLALIMAQIAGKSDRVVAALDDPVYRIRRRALAACVRDPGADEAILATLVDAAPAWRIDLVRAVRSAGRPDLADRVAQIFLDGRDEAIAARVLPACSEAVAGALLPKLAHQVGGWTALGRRHPGVTLGYARSVLAGLTEGARGGWWEAYGQALAAAAESRPGEVLDLLEEFPLRAGLPSALLERVHLLVRADEGRVLRLLVAPDGALAARWRRLSRVCRVRLAASGVAEVVVIGKTLRDDGFAFAGLLRDIAPSRRSAFFDEVDEDRDGSHAILTSAVLDALPHERRHAEARRMSALDRVAEDPDLRLIVAARLPWTEALGELRAAVRRASADDRAHAYPLLVGCAAAGDDPAEVTALVTGELGRLRNEQEPVRCGALTALAGVPAELFEEGSEVTEALTRLVIDATEARDVSWQTLDALRTLAGRVMACHPSGGLFDWALMVFQKLAGGEGALNRRRLDTVVRRGQEFAVYQAVEPWIKRGLERGDLRLPVALAASLGRRAWAIEGLQRDLAHAIRHGTSGTATDAVGYWLADPAQRSERAAELIAWDPTAAVLGQVIEVLSHRRTDLLDGYLEVGQRREGRFVASGVGGGDWFPAFRSSGRWLPRQVDAYAVVLAKVAADTGAKTEARVSAIRQLGTLAGRLGQAEVLRYVDSADVALAEAALGALVWGEDPAAHLPLLFRYADGDRARVAVYAAGRAARYARPERAAVMLREVVLSPTAKVTSRKEALRIAADLRVPGLVGLMSEVWYADRQHTDVKAAVVSRLPDCLDDPRALVLLREAVGVGSGEGEGGEVVGSLMKIQPLAVPERHRAALGELVAALCSHSDVRVARAALVAAAKWYPWTETVADAVCAAMADPGRRMSTTGLPIELNSLVAYGMPVGRYVEVLAALLAADDADRTEVASADEDRPARRRLAWIVRGAVNYNQFRAAEYSATALELVEALADRPYYLKQVMELAATTVPLDGEPEALVAALLDLAERAAGRYDAAERGAATLVQSIQRRRRWNPVALIAAIEALAEGDGAGSSAAGVIAVRLLALVGPELGWPEAYRVVVGALRRHADAAVVEMALELDTGTG